MKYAVEARIFNNGKIVAKMRPAEPGEENNYHETRTCDVWTAPACLVIYDFVLEVLWTCINKVQSTHIYKVSR